MNYDIGAFIASIIALGVAISGIITSRASARALNGKTRIDSMDMVTHATITLMEPLSKKIAQQELQIAIQEKKITALIKLVCARRKCKDRVSEIVEL